jgi:hypothetical protein
MIISNRNSATPRREQRTRSPSAEQRFSLVVFCAPPATDEQQHFFECGECGQLVDARNLGEVLYHEGIEHHPSLTN